MAQFPQHVHFPQVIFTDGNDEILVTNYYDGISVLQCRNLPPAKQNEIITKIQDKLKHLHQMHAPAYDIINNKQFANWYEWIKLIFDSYITKMRSENFLSIAQEQDIYRLLESNRQTLEQTKTSVIHGDLKPQNIIYDPAKDEVNIIDFESGKVGDPLFDTYRLYNDLSLHEKHIQDPIYVLYRMNTALRWVVYRLAKCPNVEEEQMQYLADSFDMMHNII